MRERFSRQAGSGDARDGRQIQQRGPIWVRLLPVQTRRRAAMRADAADAELQALCSGELASRPTSPVSARTGEQPAIVAEMPPPRGRCGRGCRWNQASSYDPCPQLHRWPPAGWASQHPVRVHLAAVSAIAPPALRGRPSIVQQVGQTPAGRGISRGLSIRCWRGRAVRRPRSRQLRQAGGPGVPSGSQSVSRRHGATCGTDRAPSAAAGTSQQCHGRR